MLSGAVCLRRGRWSWWPARKEPREHESIVVIEAKPMHIHAALLLLGAKPGSPATRQQLGRSSLSAGLTFHPAAGRWTCS